jgi:uncharacterized protein (TIGR03437 family)
MRLLFIPILTWLVSYSAFGQVHTVSIPAPRSVNAGGVVNSANYTAPVAPGSIASAFGTYAVTGSMSAAVLPLPTSILGLSLLFGGSTKAPLFFVDGTQVNFQAPWELAGQTSATLAASINGASTTAQTVRLAAYAPGIFTLNTAGSGPGAILDSNYQLLDSTNAAIPGSTYILIYCTGLGPVSNTPASGAPAPAKPFAETTTTPIVTIGGVKATVQFSGLAPGYVGLYQVNAQVPASTAAGTAVTVTLSIGGVASNTVTIPVSTSSSAPFNLVQTKSNSFTVGPSTLSDFPTIAATSTTGGKEVLNSVGYQDGAYAAGKAVYFPWQVLNGGTTWVETIADTIPQSVIVTYNAADQVSGFNDAGNWSYFDLTNLSWAGKGTVPNSPAGYQGGAIQGTITYPTPNSAHPVFFSYDAAQAVTSTSAYETFVPPPEGGTLGNRYGWCTAVSDGRFVYYVPLGNKTNGLSGNIFRYDTTLPFSDIGSWAAFDMATSVSSNAEAYQSAVYDGYRYVYFIPFIKPVIARYDTWGGGSAADPASFTNPASYTILDPTTLNTAGKPTITGQGSPANLAGFTGAAVDWDSAHQNEYLYFVPWATYPGNPTGGVGTGAQNPILQSTTARVRVGTMTGSTWTAVDITSTSTDAATSPEWEIYDLQNLTTNSAWPASWPTIYGADAGAFQGQNELAGFQLAFVDNTVAPLVGFVADKSQYFVLHDVDHALYDPSGWYVSPVPASYKAGTMGGAYDTVNHILYASSPEGNQTVVQFELP